MKENINEQLINDIKHHNSLATKNGNELHPQIKKFHTTLLSGVIKHLGIKREQLKGI